MPFFSRFKINEWDREWVRMEKQERAYAEKRRNTQPSAVQRLVGNKVPERLNRQLNSAFAKAFALIFEKGTGIIEKTYNRGHMQEEFLLHDHESEYKLTRHRARKFSRQAKLRQTQNFAFACVEGVSLGILGIGLPDIVLLVGVMLRSVYQTAVSYGFDYDTPEEQTFVLQLIEAAFSTGDAFEEKNDALNSAIDKSSWIVGDRKEEMRRASEAVSMEMVYMKFVQGLPVVGVVGGIFDPVYVRQLNRYAELKYRRRFLNSKR